ncbi:hypothetical protein 32HC_56 [Mycobacterium phage 32HC]|uniref:Uncharacterized protein n=1 Tax=Mycobacterium phage 32HC TaxID=1445729 RepID=W8E8U3_9CAUD|nr:hypothetical protein ST32HC_56 [Mycobacterium phage 32HC]AHJ86334.1 hypothetical protein 32HC_56 [Mycobacterium phage 32HC]
MMANPNEHIDRANHHVAGDPDDVQIAIAHALIDLAEQLREMNNRARQIYGIE